MNQWSLKQYIIGCCCLSKEDGIPGKLDLLTIERHCVTSAMRWIAIEWPRAWRWSARYNHAGRWLRVVVQNFNSETIGSSKKIKFLLEMKVSSMCKTYCTNVLQGFGRLDCPSGSRYRVAGLSISFAAIITWRNRPLPWNCTNIKRLRVNILVCVIPVETEKLRASPKKEKNRL